MVVHNVNIENGKNNTSFNKLSGNHNDSSLHKILHSSCDTFCYNSVHFLGWRYETVVIDK